MAKPGRVVPSQPPPDAVAPSDAERWSALLGRLRSKGRVGEKLAKFLESPRNRKIMAGLSR